jgi:ethanolamine-phosphate cytidylyltransferase
VSRIRNFSARHRDPLPGEKIVYYQGSFDLYHPGVVERLKLAKQQGDYLYVGLWSDEMIHYYRGN